VAGCRPGGEDAVTLWHATTTAVVPPSPTPFELQAPSRHEATTVWPADVAPRHLIYLGDAVSLVFAAVAMTRHGGEPVLLDVEVARSSLEPDPAYLEATRRLATFGPTNYGQDAASSFQWTGRVATRGPVFIRQRRVCRNLPSLKANLQRAQLAEHAERWHDDRIWREASARVGATPRSGAEWRERIGDVFVADLFEPY
jgi:hypothetical protein